MREIYLAISSEQSGNVAGGIPEGQLRFDGAGVAGGASAVDAACTLGTRRDFTVTTTEAKAWTSDEFFFSNQDGRFYVPIVRFSPTANTASIPGVLLRWKLINNVSSAVVYESEQYRPSNASRLIEPIGYIRVAPWANMTRETGIDYKLEMWAQSVSGSVTLSCDFVQLMPTDSFCRVNVIGDPLAQDETLIIDSGTQTAWFDQPSANVDYYGSPEILYGWPELKPGYADGGFLYALYHDDTAYTAPIDWPLTVTVKYRPRRRII
jgi:hypothetical protein